MHQSGEFGRGGDRRVHARLLLEGSIGDDYIAFLQDKARRLSLSLELTRRNSSVIATLNGPDALIGAFEMSAIIGTQDCQITDWSWLEWHEG